MAHFNLIDRNSAALEAIKNRRGPVCHESQLKRGRRGRTKVGVKANDQEYRRRMEMHGVLKDLSRYYPLPERKKWWSTNTLVVEGKRRMITRHRHSSLTWVLLQCWKRSKVFWRMRKATRTGQKMRPIRIEVKEMSMIIDVGKGQLILATCTVSGSR